MQSKSLVVVLLLMLSINFSVVAQQKVTVKKGAWCDFFEAAESLESGTSDFFVFKPDSEAQETIGRILDLAGLSRSNIVLQSANVPNARALVISNKRYIWYSPLFMERLKAKAQTDWAAAGIVAHEVGHQIAGHTLDPNATSSPALELEADEYAGFILFRMCATLDQALTAFKLIATEKSLTRTHPPRSARIEAVTKGWSKARQQQLVCGSSSKSKLDEQLMDMAADEENFNAAAFKALLEKGANPNYKDADDSVIKILIFRQKNSEGVKLLLQRKDVNVNATDNQGETALFGAIALSSPEIVQMLITAGADVNIKNKNGVNVLSDNFSGSWRDRVNSNHAQILSLLINAGIDVNVRENLTNKYLIIYAVEQATLLRRTNWVEIIRELLRAKKINLNARSNTGHSPLDMAVLYDKNGEVIQMIKKAGGRCASLPSSHSKCK